MQIRLASVTKRLNTPQPGAFWWHFAACLPLSDQTLLIQFMFSQEEFMFFSPFHDVLSCSPFTGYKVKSITRCHKIICLNSLCAEHAVQPSLGFTFTMSETTNHLIYL